MRTVHLQIKGKVQGVFYRAEAKQTAEALEISGWIRNVPSGDVEAVISGDQEKIAAFIRWCHKGPSGAQVKEVVTTEWEEPVQANGFQIKRN